MRSDNLTEVAVSCDHGVPLDRYCVTCDEGLGNGWHEDGAERVRLALASEGPRAWCLECRSELLGAGILRHLPDGGHEFIPDRAEPAHVTPVGAWLLAAALVLVAIVLLITRWPR
jgi:hypothetical protein